MSMTKTVRIETSVTVTDCSKAETCFDQTEIVCHLFRILGSPQGSKLHDLYRMWTNSQSTQEFPQWVASEAVNLVNFREAGLNIPRRWSLTDSALKTLFAESPDEIVAVSSCMQAAVRFGLGISRSNRKVCKTAYDKINKADSVATFARSITDEEKKKPLAVRVA